MDISVIIPVYKNRELFIKNLRHNLKFLEGCEIIIVNDDPLKSLDNDLKDLRKVILLENKKNLGFGQSINEGVKQAHNNYIMLLNSDVVLKNNSYKIALEYFKENQTLFAVSFAQKEKNGAIVGKNKIYWNKGFLHHCQANNLAAGYNAWAEGGACIIDKEKFEKLGGFDPIYKPFYWEDIDLSYRAWKSGYQILFAPNILVEHHHESTIGRYFSKRYIEQIAYRNQLFFIWKNINNPILIKNHLLNLFAYLRYPNFIVAFLKALIKIFKILKARKNTLKKASLSDNKILSYFVV